MQLTEVEASLSFSLSLSYWHFTGILQVFLCNFTQFFLVVNYLDPMNLRVPTFQAIFLQLIEGELSLSVFPE